MTNQGDCKVLKHITEQEEYKKFVQNFRFKCNSNINEYVNSVTEISSMIKLLKKQIILMNISQEIKDRWVKKLDEDFDNIKFQMTKLIATFEHSHGHFNHIKRALSREIIEETKIDIIIDKENIILASMKIWIPLMLREKEKIKIYIYGIAFNPNYINNQKINALQLYHKATRNIRIDEVKKLDYFGEFQDVCNIRVSKLRDVYYKSKRALIRNEI